MIALEERTTAPARQHGRAVVPPGPWYSVAWSRLTDAERDSLEQRGFSQDSPVGLLSSPSKMPGKSFGISAGETCPGAQFGEGTICGSCYANGAGNRADAAYGWPSVKRAYAVRQWWTRVSMMTDVLRSQWVATMAAAVVRQRYFRIHDAGDFYTPRYAEAWAMVANLCPATKFWAPTRSWHLPGKRWAESLAALAALDNVTVRPSALGIGESAPVVPYLAAGSGAVESQFNCPSSLQGGKCGDCRQCWDQPTVPIYYHLH